MAIKKLKNFNEKKRRKKNSVLRVDDDGRKKNGAVKVARRRRCEMVFRIGEREKKIKPFSRATVKKPINYN